jgi:hypothetical protein
MPILTGYRQSRASTGRLHRRGFGMSYEFGPGRQYLMPTHFGPMCGPRHSEQGCLHPRPDQRSIELYTMGFRTSPAAIEALLPPRFSLAGEAVVTLAMVYMTNIAWLAGRGYNTLGATVPARFEGDKDRVDGPFQLILWENLPEAILTGRDQLGFAKLYCDLPPPRRDGPRTILEASWQGHRFFEAETAGWTPERASSPAPDAQGEAAGILNLRYVPDVGDNSRPRIVETTLTPFLPDTPATIVERSTGTARLSFRETRWADMPTQHRIVEGLRALPVHEMLPATYVRGVGACDALGTRVLR